MADVISDLAAKAGISPDLAGKGVGTILEFCKGKLAPEDYSQVRVAVPDADGLIATSQQAAPGAGSGGMLGGAAGVVGKLFGGGGGGGAGGVADLVGRLSQSGFSMDQIQRFLPQVMAFLKDKVPPGALQKLGPLIGGIGGGPA